MGQGKPEGLQLITGKPENELLKYPKQRNARQILNAELWSGTNQALID